MDPLLAAILPHRPPMVMIDALESPRAGAAVAQKTFAPDSYGAAEGLVTEGAFIECMAQAAAALEAQRLRQLPIEIRNPKPEIRNAGMLVGISDFAFHRPARCGRPLRISVAITRRLGPYRLATGRIEQDGALVAEGILKFYVEEHNSGIAETSPPEGQTP